jgi:hypothetical protein
MIKFLKDHAVPIGLCVLLFLLIYFTRGYWVPAVRQRLQNVLTEPGF